MQVAAWMARERRWYALVAGVVGGLGAAPWAGAQDTGAVPECGTFTGTWRVVNGGVTDDGPYVDAGDVIRKGIGIQSEIGFTSVVTGNGDLVYTIPSGFGTRLGRLSAGKQWQVWTRSGWTNAATTVADVIDQTILNFQRARMYAHPTSTTGFFGVANMALHTGDISFDQHNLRTNFEFSGTASAFWTDNAVYQKYFARDLIPSWVGTEADFAYDPVTKTGLVIGAREAHLTAVRFSYQTGVERLRRWHRTSQADPGTWYTDNVNWAGDGRQALILDYNLPSTQTDGSPLVTFVPSTGRYIATFVRSIQGSGSSRVMCRYTNTPAPKWEYWESGAWHAVDNQPYFTYSPLTSRYVFGQVRHGSKVRMFTLTDSEGIGEVVYDDSGTGSVTAETEFVAGPTGGGYSVLTEFDTWGVDVNGRVWFIFTRNGNQVWAATRTLTGTAWSESLLYTDTSPVVPIGINFVNGNCVPVVFVQRMKTENSMRIFAISPNVSYWTGETTMFMNPEPAVTTLDSSKLVYDNRRVPNGATYSVYGTEHAGALAVDEDGYLYAPQLAYCALTVMPPSSDEVSENHTWGRVWDAFEFPQGAAIDNVDNKLYVATRPIQGSGFSTLPGVGQLSIWEPQIVGEDTFILRNRSVGWAGGIPGAMNTTYRPQVLTGFSWPADVAIDETRGLLYVSNAQACRIDVYEIDDILPPPAPQPPPWYSFGSSGSSNSQFRAVKGIDLDEDGNLFAVDAGNHRVVKWYRNLITNVMEQPKIIGSPGRGPGQFINPVGIDVDDANDRVYVTDPVNYRVQAFNRQGVFQFQFGKYLDGTIKPLDRTVGIVSDDNDHVFIGVGDNVERFRVP